MNGDITLYKPDLESAKKVLEVSKVILAAMEGCKPLTFDEGINALILTISGALATSNTTIEHKTKIARRVSDAILVNLYPEGIPN